MPWRPDGCATRALPQRPPPTSSAPRAVELAPLLLEWLLEWYDRSARDLPWRQPGASPWAVLVSEVMLQQTPVARVLPAYAAWLTRWPTPAALAAEQAGEAIRQWDRLGYPRRALRLHAAAQAMVARHDGAVPAEVEDLLALPGVGTYTARAVASFAFGQRHPVVDTNVRRVLARAIRGVAEGPGAAADLRLAELLLPEESDVATRFSVALMELGALICTARAPRCGSCPIAASCRWLASSRVEPAAPGADQPTPSTEGAAPAAAVTSGAPGTAPGSAGAAPAAAVTPPKPDWPRRRQPAYAGTDRHARGELLRALRASPEALPGATLLAAWSEPTQGARALASLLSDGLAVRSPDGTIGLP